MSYFEDSSNYVIVWKCSIVFSVTVYNSLNIVNFTLIVHIPFSEIGNCRKKHRVDKLDIGFVPPSKTGGLACSNSTDTRKHDKGWQDFEKWRFTDDVICQQVTDTAMYTFNKTQARRYHISKSKLCRVNLNFCSKDSGCI